MEPVCNKMSVHEKPHHIMSPFDPFLFQNACSIMYTQKKKTAIFFRFKVRMQSILLICI